MKNYRFSKYNFFKIQEDGVIILNLHTKFLFAIEKEEYEQLIFYKHNVSDLHKSNMILFNSMLKLGVIEEENFSIIHKLLLDNRKTVFSSNSYHLIINSTLNCNFSCSYCYETHTKDKMSNTTISSIKKFITSLITRDKISNLRISWFGGEPLMAFETIVRPIGEFAIKICSEHHVNFHSDITTNGYLVKNQMIPAFKDLKITHFQITLDGDKETHNKIRFQKGIQNSYDTIVDNICKLLQNFPETSITLRINYTSESLKGSKSIIDSFPEPLRRKINVSFHQVWQDEEKVTYTILDEIILLFKKAGYLITNRNSLNKHASYTCYADKYNQAVINIDGRVFKCTARDFSSEKSDGVLLENGSIDWDEELISKKLARATFDNEMCLSCEVLPVCSGLCSQKINTLNKESCSLKKQYIYQIEKTLNSFRHFDSELVNIQTYEFI